MPWPSGASRIDGLRGGRGEDAEEAGGAVGALEAEEVPLSRDGPWELAAREVEGAGGVGVGGVDLA